MHEVQVSAPAIGLTACVQSGRGSNTQTVHESNIDSRSVSLRVCDRGSRGRSSTPVSRSHVSHWSHGKKKEKKVRRLIYSLAADEEQELEVAANLCQSRSSFLFPALAYTHRDPSIRIHIHIPVHPQACYFDLVLVFPITGWQGIPCWETWHSRQTARLLSQQVSQGVRLFQVTRLEERIRKTAAQECSSSSKKGKKMPGGRGVQRERSASSSGMSRNVVLFSHSD